MKILVEIPASQLQSLTSLAKAQGAIPVAVIRNAVDAYLLPHKKPVSAYIGLWARAAEPSPEGLGLPDGVEYQDKLRSEW